MNEQVENNAPDAQPRNQIGDGLDRVWTEIKQITRSVEQETRRTGRAARLKLDLRSLQREREEVRARLGKAVYAARSEHGEEIVLDQVEGLAGGVAALDTIEEKIAAIEAEIESLHGPAPEQPTPEEQTPEQPVAEPEEVA